MPVRVLFLCAAALASGCITNREFGDRRISDDASLAKLEEGVTTKDQVRELFGEPTSVGWAENGDELWGYFFMKTQNANYAALGGIAALAGNRIDTTTMNLSVLFDGDGVLKKFHRGSQANRSTAFGSHPLDEPAPAEAKPEATEAEPVKRSTKRHRFRPD